MGEPMAVSDRRTFMQGSLALLATSLFPEFMATAASGPESYAKDLEFSSAVEAARAIRDGSVSSFELTQHILSRIEEYNAKLNAIVTLTADEALTRAKHADEALAQGDIWGPFHGVPCTVKDTYWTKGVRTTAGAPFLSDFVPAEDAVVVERLKRAGVVILGKTNVPFMADDWQSYNEVFGTTNNPWDLRRTPGGSTGGGAAALAAGLSYLSVGSDIGGSIRIPAHFCGVFGHKPTLQLVPLRGHIPPPPGGPPPPKLDLPVAGPLARSAADLKESLQILGGPDVDEAVAYRWSMPPARGVRLRDYRVGYVLDDPLCPVLPEVREVLTKTTEALKESGVSLVEGWPKGCDPSKQFETYVYLLEAALTPELSDEEFESARKLASEEGGGFSHVRARAWTRPYDEYLAALGQRMGARKIWQEYFRTNDAFLMPTAFTAAFPHDHSVPFDSRQLKTSMGMRSYTDILFWISFATLTGLPATVAPVGRTSDGLPVGIQIMGPYLEDATPIDIAGELADLVGGFQPPPGYKT
jgi:amidase